MENQSNLPAIPALELSYGDITLTCPLENGHRMVPVRRVCEIIDVDFKSQDNWLKSHQIYSQLYRLIPTTGADKKTYEMSCLSFFDLFGWLNSIGEKNRKPDSSEKQLMFMAWLRERHMEVYKAIDVFMQENKYELELIEEKERMLNELEAANDTVKEVKKRLQSVNRTIDDIREKRFTGQTALPFPENNN
jgi:hypothetical protein